MRRRRVLLSLGVSIGLHALLCVLLLRGPGPAPELSVIELEPSPAPSPTITPEQPQTPPVPAPGKHEPAARRTPRERAPAAAPDHGERPRRPQAIAPSTPTAGSPGKGTGGAPALDLSMRRPALDLRPSDDLFAHEQAPSAGSGVRAARSGPRVSEAAEESRATKERLDGLLAADEAKRNVKAGRVHPVLYDLSRDADALFRPDWSLIDQDRLGRGTITHSLRSVARSWLRSWLNTLARRPKPPSGPVPAPGAEAQPLRDLEVYNAMLKAAEDGDRILCQVCVTLRHDREAEVRMTTSSRRASFDRMAREAVVKAARLRPLPKDAQPVEACYRVQAKFSRVPPLPTVGCRFDESKPSIECFYPTKKIIRSGVKLLSVRYLPRRT